MSRFLFVLGSSRRDGNTEQLARHAARHLPADAEQRWLWLGDIPLTAFADTRHDDALPPPAGNEKLLLDAEVRFRAEFLDQAKVSFHPVVLTDERLMGNGQSLVNVDRVKRIGDHARNVARIPLIIVRHTRRRSREAALGVAASDRRRTIIQIIPAQATLIGEWLDSAAKPSGPRPGQSLPQRTAGFPQGHGPRVPQLNASLVMRI